MKMKRILGAILGAALMAGAFSDCAGRAQGNGLVKVGIINNDPNESGCRTANDKDMKAAFTEANGYDTSFAYSLKNDEQIAAAQTFIQDEVDHLLIFAAGTSGLDSVLQDAQKAGISTVYQEITLCPNLTVAAMICLFLVVQSVVLSRKNKKKA